MDDPQMPLLEALAPTVDEQASLALFRRRRARRRALRRGGSAAVAVAFVAVAAIAALARRGESGAHNVQATADTTPAQPADVAQARADVVAVFETAHDGSLTIEQRDAVIDDPSGLAAIAHEISDEYGSAADLIRATDITVEFTSATTASVHFSILSNGGTFPDRIGGAVLTGDGWKMTRATRCAEFAPARKSCP